MSSIDPFEIARCVSVIVHPSSVVLVIDNIFAILGFSLEKQTNNPLNGVKVFLSSNNSKMIISIASYNDTKYLCIIGELE